MGRAPSDGSAEGALLNPDVVLGLTVEFEDVDGAIGCVPLVDAADVEGAAGENGEGVGRSLTDET